MKDKMTALLLAIFLGFWTYIYTWQDDKGKFWWNLVLFWFGWILIFPIILIWLAAIITTAKRDEKWYKDYNKRHNIK